MKIATKREKKNMSMLKDFNKIAKMSQDNLKLYLFDRLQNNYDYVCMGDGYVYAQGTFPVLLVAHMDTVHKNLPRAILYKNGIVSSPQGIGGDDRCGIYMIMEIVKKYNFSVLFTEDEEIGGIGARKFTETQLCKGLVGTFNFIIEFDRKGKNDAVFYDCDNADFEQFVTKEFFNTAWGTFSDISVIAPELKVAAVNLSCGYYNPHTKDEYVNLYEMGEVIKQAQLLLDRVGDTKYEYVEKDYYSYDYLYDRGYKASEEVAWVVCFTDANDEEEYEEVYATSDVEAVGAFLMTYTHLTYAHILYVERCTWY